MNLGGDGQGASGVVTDVLRDTDDDAVDPHLERIKNQAGDEESDEEVCCLVNLITEAFCILIIYLHVRMKISLQTRMIVDLLLMTQVMRNQMLVIVVVKRRYFKIYCCYRPVGCSKPEAVMWLMSGCFSPQKSSKKEASSSKPVQKRKHKGRDDEGQEKKKPKKKKDPNAPKRAMTPFMYFSMAERGVSSFGE
jgi:hypothetical protein